MTSQSIGSFGTKPYTARPDRVWRTETDERAEGRAVTETGYGATMWSDTVTGWVRRDHSGQKMIWVWALQQGWQVVTRSRVRSDDEMAAYSNQVS